MDLLILQGMAFLVAAVIAPPLFRRLGFGTAVGYLCAGIVIGPSGLRVFDTAEEVVTVSQLGIVLLLFVIGLDTRITHLVAMRRDIVGLGLGQVALTTLVLAAIAIGFGVPPAGAFVLAFAFALSGTAVALQLLDERGDLPRPYGQRSFAILLAQDLLTVPMLALIPILFASQASSGTDAMRDAGLAVGVIASIVLAGRYLLDHLFRALAASGAREAMTAAALLVVLGAALAASAAGLSMALGAFIAGVMLAGSSYRHQLRADIEPFRGLLLALFFMSVGMMIDIGGVARQAALVATLLLAYLAVKVALCLALARLFGAGSRDALRMALLLASAGEFAFVLVPLSLDLGLVAPGLAELAIALAALSMIVAPPLASLVDRLLARRREAETMDEDFEGARGSVLVLGFGRFGQIASQLLLAQGVETTLVDADPERVRSAARFGFKVYYGDGERLDILRAAGAETARVVLVCLDDPNHSRRVCELIRDAFPMARVHALAHDRAHAIALMEAGVAFQIRETFESAVLCGRSVLEALGVPRDRALAVEQDVRRRDAERLELQRLKGIEAGIDLLHQTAMQPEPLVPPRREAARP